MQAAAAGEADAVRKACVAQVRNVLILRVWIEAPRLESRDRRRLMLTVDAQQPAAQDVPTMANFLRLYCLL